MSSNYRILVHFLKTLDSSVKIGLGLRNRSVKHLIRTDLLQDLKTDVRQKCHTFESVVSKCDETNADKSKDRKKTLDKEEVFDRTYMVFEGIRQYLQYVSQHKLRISPIVSQLTKTEKHSTEIPVQRVKRGLILFSFG